MNPLARTDRRTLKIASRFALVFLVIVPTLLVTALAGIYGLKGDRDSIVSLYSDHLTDTASAANLSSLIDDAQQAALDLLLSDSASEFRTRYSNLELNLAPRVDLALTRVTTESSDDSVQLAASKAADADWTRFQVYLSTLPPTASTASTRDAEATYIDSLLNHATASSDGVEAVELQQGAADYTSAIARYHDSFWLIVLVVLVGLMLAVGVMAWLVRSVLRRTLEYSSFAQGLTEGDLAGRLNPTGGDELAELGRTLDHLAERRQDEEAYDLRKVEFTESLQVTSSESEAHELLKRYIERGLPQGETTVLSRNNSADRLVAVTRLPDDSPLLVTLEGASPRSCLAIRMARTSSRSPEAPALVSCGICSGCAQATMCAPLLVGGEVIGSVLAETPELLDGYAERSIRDAVSLAAPVLGNLRNLAIAEMRAATDSLTGLPNRRALQDHVRRLVANAARSLTPLSALMCDLDHFKKINDQFGHGGGDEVLAAVGALMPGTLRTSDFAGRYGGEEFLILLPGTDSDGALVLAEKLRHAVANIRVPAVQQRVTMSIGIATFPTHATDPDSLERSADRALYAAKGAGRNRVEVVDSGLLSISADLSLAALASEFATDE
jgi:diguanylate cyclase (GGDEF)-like protein